MRSSDDWLIAIPSVSGTTPACQVGAHCGGTVSAALFPANGISASTSTRRPTRSGSSSAARATAMPPQLVATSVDVVQILVAQQVGHVAPEGVDGDPRTAQMRALGAAGQARRVDSDGRPRAAARRLAASTSRRSTCREPGRWASSPFPGTTFPRLLLLSASRTLAGMKVGLGLCPQNYWDWERYAAGAWDAPPRVPDAHIYDDAIALARLAEASGLDSVWSVEHHFTPYIMVPNPIQLLTYVAGATSRMDVGTMVTVLPWHHPLRLAAEVAVLDILLEWPHAAPRAWGAAPPRPSSTPSAWIAAIRAGCSPKRSRCCGWRSLASGSRLPASTTRFPR